MNWLNYVAAAAIAVLPMTATAGTVVNATNIEAGTNVLEDDVWFWQAESSVHYPGANDFSASFVFVSSVGQAASAMSTLEFLGDFVGLSAQWTDTASGALLYSYAFTDVTPFVQAAEAVVAIGNGPSTLTVGWDGITGDTAQINLQLAAVPLPAGVLLLGTALGGLGLARRRK